jgi:predicted component of type VI protein secretion system
MSDLVKELVNRGKEFDAFQLLVMLEEYYDINADDYGLWSRFIRLSANPEIAFPCSDVENVMVNKNGLDIVLSFLGLMGVSSPLPHYFTEYGAIHSHEKSALADFLKFLTTDFTFYFFRPGKSAIRFHCLKMT